MNLKCLVTIGGGLMLSTLSSAAVIDNFTHGVPQSIFSTGNTEVTNRVTDPGIWGGSRRITLQTNGSFDDPSRIDVVSGSATVHYGATSGFAILRYSQGYSVDWSWMREWTFNFNYLTGRVYMGVDCQSFSTNRRAIFLREIAPSATPFSATLTFADHMSGTDTDLRDMTLIQYYFFTDINNEGVELQLSSLEAVPEPATGVVALSGLLMLCRRRKTR